MKILMFVLLVTLTHAAESTTVSVGLPGEIFPRTVVLSNVTPGPDSPTGTSTRLDCYVDVILYVPTTGGRAKQVVYQNTPRPSATCGTVPVLPWQFPKDNGLATYLAGMEGLSLSYQYALDTKYPGFNCTTTYRIHRGPGFTGGYQTQYAPCNYTATNVPASCSLAGPDTIQHPVVVVGALSSTATTSLRISCTMETSVSLSFTDPELPVMSGRAKLPTTLSFKDSGGPTSITTANPDVDVVITNTINTTAESAGVYIGSTVLVATWD